MLESVVEVKNKTGLHARPASQFVKKANSFKSTIIISKDGKEANGKSIIGVLSLGIKQNSIIEIKAQGDDEKAALSQLVDYINLLDE